MSVREGVESSRTGEQAEPKPERKWVALLSAPVLLDDDDDDRDMELELHDPPRPSRLMLRNRCLHDPRRRRGAEEPPSACILAAAADRSARVLVQYGEGGIYLFDAAASARSVTLLPRVPTKLRLDVSPDRSIGLIAHPHSAAHFVVAQLQPGRHLRRPRNNLLYYSTFTGRWRARELAQPEGCTRDLSAEHGVVAHDGRLWWLALAYGLFHCDPLGVGPLRFLPLPAGCEMGDEVAFNPATSTLIKQRRCVRASEGKLRFVEIRGLSYNSRAAADDLPQADPTLRMWTLVDLDGPEPWKVEYEAPFSEIWEDKCYLEAGLPPRKVPHIAFVDPDDLGVVYFLHGTKLFGWDARKRQVVGCEEGYGGDKEQMFRRPVVDAWLPPPPMQTPMEHAFPRGTHVRLSLTEGEGLVEARDNGREVVLGTWGTMPQTAWIVDYELREGKPHMLLQSSAYGRYLAHSGVLDARTVSATGTMVDYFHPEQEELLWEFRTKQGTGDEGKFLNAKYGPWNVSSEPETVWKLKAILSTPTPPRPLPPPVTAEENGKPRKIVLFQADDAGEFNENHGDMFEFEGNSLSKLRTEVCVLQQQVLQVHYTGLHQPHENHSLCVRPGSYGLLTPLSTDLPRSVEPMHIVVLTYGSPAAAAIRYSNLDEV